MTQVGPRRHRGLFWIGLLVSAVLLVGGAAYAYGSYRDSGGADGAVRGYLHALAQGDAPGALAYGSQALDSKAATFLTSEVLRDQLKIAPIREIIVGGNMTSNGVTQVSFSYALAFSRGQQRVSDKVNVRKIHGRWRLDKVAALVDLSMSQARDRATLAGAPFPDGNTLLFPGAVPVQYDNPYLRLTLATDAVQLSQTGDVELASELTPAARTAVEKQLAAMLAVCGHGGSATAARCPLPAGQVVPGSLSGTLTPIASSLTVTVDDDYSGSITIDSDATFKGSYRQLDFNDIAQPHTGTVPVRVSASAYAVSPLTITFVVAS